MNDTKDNTKLRANLITSTDEKLAYLNKLANN